MADLMLYVPNERAVAAVDRVDRLARLARKAGDERTVEQLRADIATDLLIHGVVPGDARLAETPPVSLEITIGADVLAGLRDGVGMTPHGPISTQVCRELANGAGARARLHLTDADGVVVASTSAMSLDECEAALVHCIGAGGAEASARQRAAGKQMAVGKQMTAATGYAVPPRMAAFVAARDGQCRAPGCETRHPSADFDHDTNWSPDAMNPHAGQTHPSNLHVLDRGHHNLKTRGFWKSEQHDDGTITWRTLTMRVLTHPLNHGGADSRPFDVDEMSVELSQMLEERLGTDFYTPDQAALALLAMGESAQTIGLNIEDDIEPHHSREGVDHEGHRLVDSPIQWPDEPPF